MNRGRRFLVFLASLSLLAFLVPGGAFAGGGGGGGGGGGRGGRGGGRGTGRGKGKGGGDEDMKSRPDLIRELEEKMRASDRDARFSAGRKADFNAVSRDNREVVLKAHRRTGENARRSADSRLEAPR